MPGKWGELFWSDYLNAHPNAAALGKQHPITTLRTHAYPDAPAALGQRQCPILVFAPGMGDTPLEYSGSSRTGEPRVHRGCNCSNISRAIQCLFRWPRHQRPRHMAAQGDLGPAPRSTDEAFKRFEQVTGIWSQDLSFTLNRLKSVNTDPRSPLKGHLDMSRVGAIGHSLGGAAVLQFAHDDPRVRAVFDIDGSPVWSAANTKLAKPLLVLSAASTAFVSYDAVLGGAKPGRHLRLSGSVHAFSKDFGVIPFCCKARRDSLRPHRALETSSTRRALSESPACM
jgi:Platelet-activating factor acetylhydrolase, isoform II